LALEETSPPFSNDVNMLDAVSLPSELVRDLRNEAGEFTKFSRILLIITQSSLVAGPSTSTSNQTDELTFNVHFNNTVHQITISSLKTISKS
jgi:hypothetical protein